MTTVYESLRLDTDAMLADLARLVELESPTGDVGACVRCAEELGRIGNKLLGREPEWMWRDGRPFLKWSFGEPRVLLVGHLDTVWPIGTIDRWPFEVSRGRATGPGVFDMKAGLVHTLYALTQVERLDGVALIVNSDEETGSTSSRPLIEAEAARAGAALVMEPSADGALKIARKGVSAYELEVVGRAAHAGLEPEKGANATVEIAHQVLAVAELSRPDIGTSVTPTVLRAGTTANTVPAAASLRIDVRAETVQEQQRVDAELRALSARVPDCSLVLHGAPDRPPLEKAASARLFAMAQDLAHGLGLPPLRGAAVGGGSDGNIIAGMGVPTLDGLGAVGDHAHGEGEYIETSSLAERGAILAALVARLLA